MSTNDLFITVVFGCLVLGYCIKHATLLEFIPNKDIPTILAIVGAITYCMAIGIISLENIITGAFAGLVSTGFHQAFSQFINNKLETYAITPNNSDMDAEYITNDTTQPDSITEEQQ